MRTTTLRAPYRSRAIIRSGCSGQTDEASLGRGILFTQIALIALCAARGGTDLLRGPQTIEGDIAIALFAVLAAWLVAKAIGWAIRGRARKRSVSTQFLQSTKNTR